MPQSTAELLLESMEREGPRRIERFVQEATSEDLYIDFVTKRDSWVAELHIDDRRNFAKALSGFANSDGGLLVWGVVATRDPGDPTSPDVAREISPVQDLRGFIAHLNNQLPTVTRPAISGARNISIPDAEGSNSGYVVSFVPAGADLAHRAELDIHRYYKRSGASFVEMEPYEIRDVVFRFHYPKIELEFSRRDLEITGDRHLYSLEVVLHNHGPTTLREYKLLVWLPRRMYVEGAIISEVGEQRLDNTIYKGLAFRTSSVHHVLFPGESLNLLGEAGGPIIKYRMDHDLYMEDFQKKHLYWDFHGHDMPPQTGKLKFLDEILEERRWLVNF